MHSFSETTVNCIIDRTRNVIEKPVTTGVNKPGIFSI